MLTKSKLVAITITSELMYYIRAVLIKCNLSECDAVCIKACGLSVVIDCPAAGDPWHISVEERTKHDGQFLQLKPQGQFITGQFTLHALVVICHMYS